MLGKRSMSFSWHQSLESSCTVMRFVVSDPNPATGINYVTVSNGGSEVLANRPARSPIGSKGQPPPGESRKQDMTMSALVVDLARWSPAVGARLSRVGLHDRLKSRIRVERCGFLRDQHCTRWGDRRPLPWSGNPLGDLATQPIATSGLGQVCQFTMEKPGGFESKSRKPSSRCGSPTIT